MLKRLVNEVRFILTITTTGPLLVQTGHPTLKGPNMSPVRTYRNGNWEVFLPGSSLKGVFRSHLEKVIRTLNDSVICNPFLKTEDVAQVENGELHCPEYTNVACSDKFEVRQKEGELPLGGRKWRHLNPETNLTTDSEQVYADSCPACRLFGSTSFIGRVSISDAYLAADSQERTELRDGVGIDRLTGGAADGAKFELEVVSSDVTFEADVYLRNFEVWQLGALLLLADDLRDGLIRIGSGGSRGLGAVTGRVDKVDICHLGVSEDKSSSQILGLGSILADGTYGTQSDDLITLDQDPSTIAKGIRHVSQLEEDGLSDLQTKAMAAFVKRMKGWTLPPTMRFEHLQFEPVGG